MSETIPVVLVNVTVDIPDGQSYDTVTEKLLSVLTEAFPDGWRGVFSEAFEPIEEDPEVPS